MTAPRDALHRLCEHVGIAAGFRDIWGRDHETSAETRVALLKAMGVIGDEGDVAEALRLREDGVWRRTIPAVCVRREDELPYRWEICLNLYFWCWIHHNIVLQVLSVMSDSKPSKFSPSIRSISVADRNGIKRNRPKVCGKLNHSRLGLKSEPHNSRLAPNDFSKLST